MVCTRRKRSFGGRMYLRTGRPRRRKMRSWPGSELAQREKQWLSLGGHRRKAQLKETIQSEGASLFFMQPRKAQPVKRAQEGGRPKERRGPRGLFFYFFYLLCAQSGESSRLSAINNANSGGRMGHTRAQGSAAPSGTSYTQETR